MLYLYKNFTPNIYSTQHYWYNSLTAFKNAITTYKWLEFEPDKYTINNGTIRVYAAGLTQADANEVTYIIDMLNKRAYHVDTCVYQSGYLVINARIDYWGTFIYDADFVNFYVKRCNRKLSYPVSNPVQIRQGFYDSIKSVDLGTKTYTPFVMSPAFSTTDIYFVFVANIGIKQSHGSGFDDVLKMVGDLLAGTMSSTTRIYATPFTTSIQSTCEKISNIYEIQQSQNLNHAVAVTKCFMLPSYLLNLSSSATTFNTYYTGNTSTLSAYQVNLVKTSIDGDIPIDPNYEYYIGTPIKYMRIPRTTESQHFVCEGIAGQASFQVNVQCENQVLDISDAFEVTLTYNNGSKTGTDIMAHTFKTLTGILNAGTTLSNGLTPNRNREGAITGYNGSAVQIAQGTLSSALETCKVISDMPTGSINSQAEGIVSYYNQLGTVQNPLGITTFKSVSDEQAQARTFGVSYESVWDSPDTLKDCTGIQSATVTFIQAEISIKGIPVQAIDAIQNMFANGILLIDNRT